MKRRKSERKLIREAVGIYFYEDNIPFINQSLIGNKKTRSEVLRELIDEGIRHRKIKDNGFDQTAENYTKYLTVAVSNALRPLRKQLDDLTAATQTLNHEVGGKINGLVLTGERGNERTRLIGESLDQLTAAVARIENQNAGTPNLIAAELRGELAEIKTLAELSARNLIGIRVVVWLYLIEMLGPLVKNYSGITRQQFTQVVKEHVSRLFTDDVLKELAFMKANEVEEYIQHEVVNLYKGILDITQTA